MREFYLPPSSNKDAVEEAMRYHRVANATEHYQKSIAWTTAHWWLQGLRSFRYRSSASSGIPSSTFTDDKGRRRVRFEKALVQCQTEMGRLLAIDIEPAIARRRGVGLDVLRMESVAQATLGYLYNRMPDSLKSTFCYQLCAYGTVGVGVFPGLKSWEPDIILIPAWELMPLPSSVAGLHELAGLTWARWVPLSWLKENYKDKLNFSPSDNTKLRTVSAPWGSKLHRETSPQPLAGVVTAASATTGGAGPIGNYSRDMERILKGRQQDDKSELEFVELQESWIYDSHNQVTRYIVMLGDHLALDIDFCDEKTREALNLAEGEYPFCPVSTARYSEVGSFWGRAYVDRLIPLNKELEYVVGDFVENIRETDRLRLLAIPASMGVTRQAFKMALRNRFLTYATDPVVPAARPEIIAPPNVDDRHGPTINMMGTMLNDLSAQGELLYGGIPGRADSGQAIQTIAQEQDKPLAATGESVAMCWAGVWRCCLGLVRLLVDTGDQKIVIKAGRIDESVIGLKFDSEQGTLSLAERELPDPRDLKITIRTKNPRSKQSIYEGLKELLSTGLITPVEFQIAAIKEGLELPFMNRTLFHHYESAWLRNIIIFGDGKTPGNVVQNDYAENHPIYLSVLMELMSSPVFTLAAPEVQKKLIALYQHHQAMTGRFPDQATSVDQFGTIHPPDPAAFQAAGAPTSGIGQAIQ